MSEIQKYIPQDARINTKHKGARLTVAAAGSFLLAITGCSAPTRPESTPTATPPASTATAINRIPCNVNLLIEGFRFSPKSTITGDEGRIDPTDYVIGRQPNMGIAVIRRVDDPANRQSLARELLRVPMNTEGDHAEALVPVQTTANTADGKSVQLTVSFFNDQPEVQTPVLVVCGGDKLVLGGRIASAQELDNAANDQSGIDLVGTRAEALTKLKFNGRSPRLSDQSNNPAQNKADLKANLGSFKEALARVRAREQDQAQKAK